MHPTHFLSVQVLNGVGTDSLVRNSSTHSLKRQLYEVVTVTCQLDSFNTTIGVLVYLLQKWMLEIDLKFVR